MNLYQAQELVASDLIRARAGILVGHYAEPTDAAAARLAVLMLATEQEARAQGIHAELIFSHGVQE